MTARDLLPSIRRARGYRLYDGRRRYLDLWQEDGHALLGHRPDRVRSDIKQALDRGLLAAYPGPWANRLEGALALLMPDRRSFRWYASPDRRDRLLAELTGERVTVAADPAVSDITAQVMLYRPWLADRSAVARVLLPVLPLPGSGWLSFVAAAEALPAEFHPSDPVSPALLTGMCRAVHELIAHLREFDTAVWARFDSELWERRGPYLALRCAPDEFRPLFRELLDRGMIVAPDYGAPSIVPATFDEGEIVPIRSLKQARGA